MEAYVASAIAKGLQRIVFLEHLEQGIRSPSRTWLTEADFDRYFEEGTRLKARYDDQIEVLLGVEVGFNPACPEMIRKRLKRRSWDCIGLSYHFVEIAGLPHHVNLLSREKSYVEQIRRYGADKMLSRYFDTLIEAVQLIPAHVLCHLDAGLRHCQGLDRKHRQQERITRLLREVKRAGMKLEINTSGYPLRAAPFPAPAIINEAVDLGIGLTLGSDAHNPDEVGRFFEKIPALLNQETHPSPLSGIRH